MNNLYRKIILILVISFSLVEAFYYYNNIIKYEEINITTSDIKYRSLEELYYECGDISSLEVISANKEENAWNLKIKITGSRENIKEQIAKLNKSTIKDYKIWKNGDENNIMLVLNGK